MKRLHQLGVVSRFRPHTDKGSLPYHYTLGPVGHLIRAAGRGEDGASFKAAAIHERWQRSQQLQHLLAINGFFTELLGEARRSGGRSSLERWWSERRCKRAMGKLVRPDGYGIWRDGLTRTEFCLEVDRSTEERERVARKLRGYQRLQAASNVERWILFWFETERREMSVRRFLVHSALPIATGNSSAKPQEQIWLPLGEKSQRYGLSELGIMSRINAETTRD